MAKNITVTCECGRPKSKNRQACDRCNWLDGAHVGQAEIIWALRHAEGPLTAQEIAAQLGVTDLAVCKATQRMAHTGRIVTETSGEHADGRAVRRYYALAPEPKHQGRAA